MSDIALKRSRKFVGVLTLLVGAVLIACHWFQFDLLAAVTLIPPWLWLIPAMIGVVVSARAVTAKVTMLSVVAWLLFAFLFVEEGGSLLRDFIVPAAASESSIRIVTLNTCFGNSEAIREAAKHMPDILLLQESPGDAILNSLSREVMGTQSGWISCGDASIMAKGEVVPIVADPQSHFAHAVITLPRGRKLDVVSLRLSAPVFRMDFWNAGFWNDHRATRVQHREQLQQVRSHLKKRAETDFLIVGGDFNLVGGDGALNAFTTGPAKFLSDSFYRSGAGWCGSGTSDYPLFRVDQIWTNDRVKPQINRTLPSNHSDHRMVLLDAEFDP